MALLPSFGNIVPSQKAQALETNYLNFTDTTNPDFVSFAQQYLPEIYESEVERYGNRTLAGFLRMVGAEMPMSSDQVIWAEQNRLHVAYDGVEVSGANELTIDLTNPEGFVGNVISKNVTTADYDAIGVAGAFHVTLIEGNEGKITLKGEENLLEYVIIETDGSDLKIKTEKGYSLNPSKGKKIEIIVPVKDIVYFEQNFDLSWINQNITCIKQTFFSFQNLLPFYRDKTTIVVRKFLNYSFLIIFFGN